MGGKGGREKDSTQSWEGKVGKDKKELKGKERGGSGQNIICLYEILNKIYNSYQKKKKKEMIHNSNIFQLQVSKVPIKSPAQPPT